MQGTSTVIVAMDPWKHESQFGDFISERSTFPTAPSSPKPDHKPCQPRQEDLDVFQRTLDQLLNVEAHLKRRGEDTKQFAQLVTFVKGARKVSPTDSVQAQFDRLKLLRKWLFWLPVLYLQRTAGTPSALLSIAHYYTVALLMERLFPEIGAAYFGSMAIGPVEEIARRLLSLNNFGSEEGDPQTALALMEFPINTVSEFRSRMGWNEPVRTPSFPQFDPPNFYLNDAGSPPMQLAPTPEEYMPYGANPSFSYSTEDLSVVTTEPGPSGPVSPFTNPQYLGIPDPRYGGYSPTSSNYGDYGDASSIGYSDHEDLLSYDMGYSPTTPMLGGPNSYGLGFVHPIQTVWT